MFQWTALQLSEMALLSLSSDRTRIACPRSDGNSSILNQHIITFLISVSYLPLYPSRCSEIAVCNYASNYQTSEGYENGNICIRHFESSPDRGWSLPGRPTSSMRKRRTGNRERSCQNNSHRQVKRQRQSTLSVGGICSELCLLWAPRRREPRQTFSNLTF